MGLPPIPVFTVMHSSPSPARPVPTLGLQANSEPLPTMNTMNSGYTPMLLSTDSNGVQTLTPMPVVPNMQPSMSPVAGLPFVPMDIPTILPILSMSPSMTPSPRFIKT